MKNPQPTSNTAGNRGSVLMETVLVIPLYLLLLGGLFIVGDIMLARFHLSAVERTYAWRGGNRFPGANNLRPAVLEMMPEKHLVQGQTFVFQIKTANGQEHENQLAQYVGARAAAKVLVPFWIGMANTAQAINPNDTEEPHFKSEYDLYNGAEFFRSHLVRRKIQDPPETEGSDDRLREAQADKLDLHGVIFNHQVLESPPIGPRQEPTPLSAYERNPMIIPLCE